MERKRLFGTNGVRGIVNEDMNSELALRMGIAIGKFMDGPVAIASDTRVSADMIRSAVSAGMMSIGCNILDLGVIPTPALQYFVKTHNLKGGVMITASHNPPKFNGIKCVSPDGTEMSRTDEEAIEDLFYQEHVFDPSIKVGAMERVIGAAESYVDAVISLVDADAIRNAGLRAVVDCANGAAFCTTPLLMKKLGVKATTLNADPQGEFPGHPSEPTEDNLSDLICLMRSANADIGIAHDGDADRTVFITSDGSFVSGDKSLAIIARSELKIKPGLIVTPVSTSSMVEEVVRQNGGTVMYTAVGSPTVARAMISSNAVFGGEENGGLIFPSMQYCRDGAMTVAKMLECIVKHGPLKEQTESLPVYHTAKLKVECRDECKPGLMAYLASVYKNVERNDTDGLKLIYDDGWVLIRPSGTEPIFRIYSESKDEDVANRRGNEFKAKAEEFLALN